MLKKWAQDLSVLGNWPNWAHTPSDKGHTGNLLDQDINIRSLAFWGLWLHIFIIHLLLGHRSKGYDLIIWSISLEWTIHGVKSITLIVWITKLKASLCEMCTLISKAPGLYNTCYKIWNKLLMFKEIHYMEDNYTQCATSEKIKHLYIIWGP